MLYGCINENEAEYILENFPSGSIEGSFFLSFYPKRTLGQSRITISVIVHTTLILDWET